MRITLHVGAWKTGSTAIQQFLMSNRDELGRRGLIVPPCMDSPQRRYALQDLKSGNADRVTPVVDEFKTAIATSGSDELVFSSEHFWQLSIPELINVREALSPLADDIRIILYVRAQDDMWNSLYSQQAKSFRVSPTAALWGTNEYVADGIAEWAIYYHRCLGMFAEVFGRDAITVRAYQRKRLVGGDVALDFAEYLGVDTEGLNLIPSANPSFGWKSVAFSLWAHQQLGIKQRLNDDFQLLRRAFRTAMKRMNDQTADGTWIGKTPNVLGGGQRREIRAHYAEDNQRLFDDYFYGRVVFDPPKDPVVDSVRWQDIPEEEFDLARRKMLTILRNRRYDVSMVAPVLRPKAARPAKPAKPTFGQRLFVGSRRRR